MRQQTQAVSHSAGALGIAASAGIGLLPKLTCPLCWPAYSAVLGALGVGFIDYTPFLLPLTSLFVAVTLAALAWTSRARRSVWPLATGAPAGAALLMGKFAFDSEAIVYAAVGLFVAAAFVPVRRRPGQACAACASPPAKETHP
jgi:hypothetical protein